MFKIIGGDQKEYGPVTADQLREWMAQGRVNLQTLILSEGTTEWKPLSAFPELAGPGAGLQPALSPGGTTPSPEEILARDYELDIGGCVGNGWNLFKTNFGLLFGSVLIYFAIEFAIGLLGAIPIIGPLFSLANLFIIGPLLGGLYYLYLRAIRHESASIGDLFAGFHRAYLHLFLGQLIPGLLASICFIPAAIVAIVVLMPALVHHIQPAPGQVLPVVAAALVCFIPVIFLTVNWIFTLPLVVDRQMSFWPAMQLSWKMVRKHWWMVLLLVIIVALINIGGMFLCCVGILFTMPIGMGALMYAYETIFGRKNA